MCLKHIAPPYGSVLRTKQWKRLEYISGWLCLSRNARLPERDQPHSCFIMMLLLRIHCDAAVLLYQSNALLRAKNGRRIHIRLDGWYARHGWPCTWRWIWDTFSSRGSTSRSAEQIGAFASVKTGEGREKSVQTPEVKKRTRVTLLNTVTLERWGSQLQSIWSPRMFSRFFVSYPCVASARHVLKTALDGRSFGGSSCSNVTKGLLLSNTMFTDKAGLRHGPWSFTISIQTTQIIPSRHQQQFSINVWVAIKGDTPVCPSCFSKQADKCSLSCHLSRHTSTVTTECPSTDWCARFILNTSVSMSG